MAGRAPVGRPAAAAAQERWEEEEDLGETMFGE
jgi:hypothetical protein